MSQKIAVLSGKNISKKRYAKVENRDERREDVRNRSQSHPDPGGDTRKCDPWKSGSNKS